MVLLMIRSLATASYVDRSLEQCIAVDNGLDKHCARYNVARNGQRGAVHNLLWRTRPTRNRFTVYWYLKNVMGTKYNILCDINVSIVMATAASTCDIVISSSNFITYLAPVIFPTRYNITAMEAGRGVSINNISIYLYTPGTPMCCLCCERVLVFQQYM